MKKLIVFAAVAVCGIAFADTYDERLEFLETTGTQWIDTGLRLNFKYSRVRGRFRLLENPVDTVGLCGVCEKKGNLTGRDSSKGNLLYSFAICVGMPGTSPKFIPAWVGNADATQTLYTQDISLDWGYEFDGLCAYVKLNGGSTTLGYSGYQAERPDVLIEEGRTFYIGNVNNGGEGCYTESGKMPKVHWYGVTFWTYNKETQQDELIGDFIPVRKNGVAGFFDTVTETFFPSQGTDPFVAPNRIAWTGNGAAGSFLDKDNWDGVAAPAAKTDVAVIPDKTIVTGTYPNLKAIQKIGAISLAGADSLLKFSTATEEIRVFVPLFGKGTLRCESTGQTAYFCSESSAFEGLLDFYDVSVRLDTFHGFGGEQATVRYDSSNSYRLSFNIKSTSPVPFALHVVRGGGFIYPDAGVSFDGPVYLDGDSGAQVNFTGTSATCPINFNGAITNTSTTARTLYFSSSNLGLGGEEKYPGLIRFLATSADINVPVHCAVMPKGGIKSQFNLGLWPEEPARKLSFRFGADIVLGEYAALLINYDYDLFNSRPRHFNLNGYSQTIGTLSVHSEHRFCWNDPTQNHFATNTIIWSDTPATLTLAGYCRNSMLDPEKSYVYPGRLNGELSFVLDSRTNVMATAYDELPDNCGIIRFTSALSTTCGGITAKRGLIDIRSQAAFSNLTALAVTGEGQIHVRTAAIGIANEAFHVAATNVTTGRIEIDEGLVLKANTAQMGDRWLDAGDYAAEAADGVRPCKYISGAGILRVRTYGGPKGMMLILR